MGTTRTSDCRDMAPTSPGRSERAPSAAASYAQATGNQRLGRQLTAARWRSPYAVAAPPAPRLARKQLIAPDAFMAGIHNKTAEWTSPALTESV